MEIEVSPSDWLKYYNQANSEVYTEHGGKSGDGVQRTKANEAMKLGRRNGYTRDRAIWVMWKRDKIDNPHRGMYMDMYP